MFLHWGADIDLALSFACPNRNTLFALAVEDVKIIREDKVRLELWSFFGYVSSQDDDSEIIHCGLSK